MSEGKNSFWAIAIMCILILSIYIVLINMIKLNEYLRIFIENGFTQQTL